ncbi:MAG: HDIG domain-containing protein, partial [Anaerolineae bacterium]
MLVVLLLLLGGIAAWAAVVYAPAVTAATRDLKVGDVAPEDILAPAGVSYTSEVRTAKQRESAAQAVAPRYTQPDTAIARQQLDRLRAALAYISSVRADAYADREQKLVDLAAMKDLRLSAETAESILALNEARWQAVQQEAITVLEQVMRNTIREDRLDAARASVPNLVSLSLPPEQADIVAELVAAFIAPNSFYSESLTEAARQAAAEMVEPVTVTYAPGELVVERGKVLSEEDIEALRVIGLTRPAAFWQEALAAGLLVLLALMLAAMLFRRKPHYFRDLRPIGATLALFLAFLTLGRLAFPLHPLVPFVFPLAAYALILSGLFGAEVALVTSIPLIALLTFGQQEWGVLILYYGLEILFGVLIPRREQRFSAYLWVGVTVAATGATVLVAVRLLNPLSDWMLLLIQVGTTALQGMLSAGLAVFFQYLLAPLLGQVTALQLVELSRPDAPLLEHLLRNAPGTYQHSLQVANLAEQAAERIEADSLLTRVGALYHDIGKSLNPYFFIENQQPSQPNPHNDLDPAESAAIIIRHVTDGLDLARRYRLPQRIAAFISEHHGTLQTRYQLAQALKQAAARGETVDEALFTYPGPRPQSRETALVMLADGVEARMRAEKPATEGALRALIKSVIDNRLDADQLADTSLTLQDLRVIQETFYAALRGVYHPRIDYPTLPT